MDESDDEEEDEQLILSHQQSELTQLSPVIGAESDPDNQEQNNEESYEGIKIL